VYSILVYYIIVGYMPRVSRRKLPEEDQEKIVELLVGELAKLTNTREFEALFGLLTTDEERVMLAKRMAVFVMTDEGIADGEIAKNLNLTRVTVQKLRLTYLLSKEKKDLVVSIIQNPLLKKLLKGALPKAFG
jgi:hypothetical protein